MPGRRVQPVLVEVGVKRPFFALKTQNYKNVVKVHSFCNFPVVYEAHTKRRIFLQPFEKPEQSENIYYENIENYHRLNRC